MPKARTKSTYTVLLLRPEYMTSSYGLDTYLCYVRTPLGVDGAVRGAQRDAVKADAVGIENARNYVPLITLKGRHQDLTSAGYRQ